MTTLFILIMILETVYFIILYNFSFHPCKCHVLTDYVEMSNIESVSQNMVSLTFCIKYQILCSITM